MAQSLCIFFILFLAVPAVTGLGFAPARAGVPAGYVRFAGAAFFLCVFLIWLVLAFFPVAEGMPINKWGWTVAWRWLGLTACAVGLSLFVPLLIAYALVRKLAFRKALAWSVALGLVAVASFAVVSTALMCFVFFSC